MTRVWNLIFVPLRLHVRTMRWERKPKRRTERHTYVQDHDTGDDQDQTDCRFKRREERLDVEMSRGAGRKEA